MTNYLFWFDPDNSCLRWPGLGEKIITAVLAIKVAALSAKTKDLGARVKMVQWFLLNRVNLETSRLAINQ
jgi:hypothetical protein